MPENFRELTSFVKAYKKLAEVLTDHELAALGDAFINFAYSLAISEKRGQPYGAKVKGAILARAFRKAGLRGCMPSRVTSHMLADAAEALSVYAWLQKNTTLEETVRILRDAENPVEGFAELLSTIKSRVRF